MCDPRADDTNTITYFIEKVNVIKVETHRGGLVT